MPRRQEPPPRPAYFPYDSHEEKLLAQFEYYFENLARVRLLQRLWTSSSELNVEKDRLRVARREFGQELRRYLEAVGLELRPEEQG